MEVIGDAALPRSAGFKHRLYEILELTRENDRVADAVAGTIVGLILVSVVGLVLESVEALRAAYALVFEGVEVLTVTLFAIEYAARLWACTENPKFGGPIRGRVRYAVTFLALIDFAAVAPFYAGLALAGANLSWLRVLRVLRIFRLAKLSRYSPSLQMLGRVAAAKREELVVTVAISFTTLLIASTVLYFLEHESQPERFSSIPHAMWWGVATLTTVGYGDVYPVTPLGKLFGGIFAFAGIAMFALPIAILSSAFNDEFQRMKKKEPDSMCPHCGHRID